MSHPMPRLCDRFRLKELNSHSFALRRRVVDMAEASSADLMYLYGKAIQLQRSTQGVGTIEARITPELPSYLDWR